jgi:hypothetical protein
MLPLSTHLFSHWSIPLKISIRLLDHKIMLYKTVSNCHLKPFGFPSILTETTSGENLYEQGTARK